VATPGRLKDHIATTKCLDLKSVRWLILDEADR
jgi:ATP-dependent RNA helicase DDX31/DBP7